MNLSRSLETYATIKRTFLEALSPGVGDYNEKLAEYQVRYPEYAEILFPLMSRQGLTDMFGTPTEKGEALFSKAGLDYNRGDDLSANVANLFAIIDPELMEALQLPDDHYPSEAAFVDPVRNEDDA